jgi:probable HAF family extracellular repeat protein
VILWVAVAALSLAAMLFGPVPSSRAEILYTVTDLGPAIRVSGLNASGQVVGTFSPIGVAGDVNPFRTRAGQPIDPVADHLGSLGREGGEALGINASGQAVGWSYDAYGTIRPFRTAPNTPINPETDDLGVVLGVIYPGWMGGAEAINDVGQVVGYGAAPGWGADHPFRTGPNAPLNLATDDLGSLGGLGGFAVAINALGQVAGSSPVIVGGASHAFRTAPNLPINPATDDLGTLGGANSEAKAINDLGQVCGVSELPDGRLHAFLTGPNAPINPATDDIGGLGGRSATATSLNNRGQVVGVAALPGDLYYHAFLYDGSGMRDLNDLIDSSLGWELGLASAINNSGQIAGMGHHNGEQRAFLLTPTPEPTTIALLLGAGAAALLLGGRKRDRSTFQRPR